HSTIAEESLGSLQPSALELNWSRSPSTVAPGRGGPCQRKGKGPWLRRCDGLPCLVGFLLQMRLLIGKERTCHVRGGNAPLALLHHVRQFVADQRLALSAPGIVVGMLEKQVGAAGKGVGTDRLRETAQMDTDVREGISEGTLHLCLHRPWQRLSHAGAQLAET